LFHFVLLCFALISLFYSVYLHFGLFWFVLVLPEESKNFLVSWNKPKWNWNKKMCFAGHPIGRPLCQSEFFQCLLWRQYVVFLLRSLYILWLIRSGINLTWTVYSMCFIRFFWKMLKSIGSWLSLI
jgi:hypothetical protein